MVNIFQKNRIVCDLTQSHLIIRQGFLNDLLNMVDSFDANSKKP